MKSAPYTQTLFWYLFPDLSILLEVTRCERLHMLFAFFSAHNPAAR